MIGIYRYVQSILYAKKHQDSEIVRFRRVKLRTNHKQPNE